MNAMKQRYRKSFIHLAAAIRRFYSDLRHFSVFLGRRPSGVTGPAVVLLPASTNRLNCGLAGLISVYGQSSPPVVKDLNALRSLTGDIVAESITTLMDNQADIDALYLKGEETVDRLYRQTRELMRPDQFLILYRQQQLQDELAALHQRLAGFIRQEVDALAGHMGHMEADDVKIVDSRIEKIKDSAWCIRTEILDNLIKVESLSNNKAASDDGIKIYRNINAVLNSIDRLEVRGRDSAGISLLFMLDDNGFAAFKKSIDQPALADLFTERTGHVVLSNGSITIDENQDGGLIGVTLTFKVAAEIGSLGDNVAQLRHDIATDAILRRLIQSAHRFHTVSAHTRWASVGAITIANCHPVDNGIAADGNATTGGIIHACLNGDIDNYLTLKEKRQADNRSIPEEVTTDTKIIPLQVEHYIAQGHPVEEAFRLAVNDFEGSHAIALQTDLAPGKFFLAQRGSGQAVFVGMAKDHYIPTSEVYGFVEETSRFIKMNGEKVFDGPNGQTQGQIFILDQQGGGGIAGVTAFYYDGTPIELSEQDVQSTEITSRDIDRQGFPHYFLKEISEAPLSVERTLSNRWKVDDNSGHYNIALDSSAFPQKITEAFKEDRIRRIHFIGQGTAGIAALASADILSYYLEDPSIQINALKASELSGFQLCESDDESCLQDALVVAISQSGTTTDTNRAVDMAKARGAYTMAIVNRRDSDITFKVDGVVYTSSGRDIEMSVASTKAFYSQIVASTLVGLKIATIKQRRPPAFITEEIMALRQLPVQMRKVLTLGDKIKASAEKLAPTKTYWAAVGSGPNKAAADEIRIKLSELCYKTISSDYVEDKKHIDLSSEPLIIVCAAGTNTTVIGDIIKDTAIFKAHKATPVVFVDEGDDRFDPYAEDIFHVPAVSPHLAPVINTLTGHLWGYYAALAINDGSRFLHDFREEIQATVDQYASDGLDVYEIVLEGTFREKIAQFYARFRRRQSAGRLPSVISHASDLLLLLKYLSGRLPVSDFELDFGKKGTALNILNSLFEFLGQSINGMSRPVDAIKHQAKTVTVGTSRISEKIEGILFDALTDHDIINAQLINRNVMVLKNLQGVVESINGSIHYRLDGLDVLGQPTDHTTIQVLRKEGVLKALPSRVETDTALKGTKRIIVHQGNVYIGKGRKDDRSIIVIPANSTDPSASNRIEDLLLLNISFKSDVPLPVKIKALGGKYENIMSIVQENSVIWEDIFLELVPIDDLFGLSAEKIAESIVFRQT